MAGKVSTLTWDAPPNGGSDITSYRVLVYEADQQVDTLTSNQPGVQVTASETVERTALIQALNDLGYSAPAILAIPQGSDTPTVPSTGVFTISGGGSLSASGVAMQSGGGGGTPAGDPGLTITRGAGGLTFSVTTSSPGMPISLYFYDAASGNDGLYTGNMPNPFTDNTPPYSDPDQIAAYPKWRVKVGGVYSNYVNAPASGPLTVPVYRLVPGDRQITVEQTSPGGGYDRLDLVRNNQAYRTGITLPFVDDQLVNGTSYTYWVVAVQGTSSQAGPTLSARPAPPLAVGPEGTAQGRSFAAGLIQTAPEFTADGVATWSTANKSPSANETAFTTSFGRARIPMWFKFHLSAGQVVRISGLPSNTNLGFINADSSTPSDSFAYLFSGPSGTVTDADLASSVLTIVAQDDDAGGSGQPYLNQQLAAGWYYILIAGYSQNATIADGRLAFRFMP